MTEVTAAFYNGAMDDEPKLKIIEIVLRRMPNDLDEIIKQLKQPSPNIDSVVQQLVVLQVVLGKAMDEYFGVDAG